jgi:hypothetical protein
MDCRVAPVLAAFALAIVAVPCMPMMSAAQTPAPADSGVVDPPESVYSTGAVADDPVVERALRTTPPHRAFLPVAIDLSSRMPAVGNQGKSSSCVAWATAYAGRSYYTGTLERRNIRALSLADYPFNDACVPPASPDLVARAHDFQVRGFKRVDIAQTDDVKGQLAQLNPVMISFNVGTAFMRFRGGGTFTGSRNLLRYPATRIQVGIS